MINTDFLKKFYLFKLVKRYSTKTFAVLLMLFVTLQVYGQAPITITGTVVDEQGEAIIGASIMPIGENTGTITDLDGNFTLTAKPQGSLKVTYIGYVSQTVEIKNRSSIKITLKEDNKVLDEVIVVGYGTQRVKDLTGAATAVKMDELENLPGASIVDALAGQVVGLNVSRSSGRPGSVGTFTVRSPAPILEGGSGNRSPLIVIDDVVQVDMEGYPDMSAFNMLDHSEIESITVLKDASAAIYGSRASNGVILVKTKRGKVGAPQISYSTKLDLADAVGHVKMMDAYDVGIFTNRLLRQTDANKGGNNSQYMYSADELAAMEQMNYNWLDKAWSSSLSHRHSLNLSGGSENATYFAGLSYQNQGANLGDLEDYDKWTFRTGTEIKVANGLKLSASVAGYNNKKVAGNNNPGISDGSWGRRAGSDGDYIILRHMPQYMPWSVNIETKPGVNEDVWISPYVGPHAANNANNITALSAWNFFANRESGSKKITEENGYNANFTLTYDVPFIKGLSLKGTYSLSYNNSFNENIQSYYTLARAKYTYQEGLHLVNSSTMDQLGWELKEYPNASSTASIVYNKRISKSEQMNFMISYDKKIKDHSISAVGVVERGESSGSSEQLTYKNPFKNYNGTSITAGDLQTGQADTYLKKYESASLSYIGRLNYKYQDRYLAQFLIRTDASTKFAPENYWGTFPSGSIGWVVSEEGFFKDSKVAKYLDYLKIRYSLGLTGKDNVAAWSWLNYYAYNSGLGFGKEGGENVNGLTPSATPNRNIKWDETVKANYGIDFNILDNRLSATVDYFHDKTRDLIMIPYTSSNPIYIGASIPPYNYGSSTNWGWEFSLRWNDKINQSLFPKMGPIKYSVGMDYSTSWYKVNKGQDPVFTYPASMNNESSATGYRWPDNTYGLKVWKNTSTKDGILRTDEDVQKYWQYLKDLAVAHTGNPNAEPSYLGTGIGSDAPKNIYKGMLAYQDLAGGIDHENKTIGGPDGAVSTTDGQDYAKLASNRTHGINTKLGVQWGDFSWSAQIVTRWGGFAAIDYGESQTINSTRMIWSQPVYANDMYDPTDNPNGKYPSMAVDGAWNMHSDFWQVSSLRCFVRNMTFSYSIPKYLLKQSGIDRVQVSVTGDNLWDFYNPYPKKYRNMYDNATKAYPTLRTWTFSLNLTF